MADYDDEEDQWEAANEKARAWLNDLPKPKLTAAKERGVDEALYTIEQRNLWIEMDGIRIDRRDALLIWGLVERIRNEGFPDDLRM